MYRPGDLMTIGGGSLGPYRLVERVTGKEVQRRAVWFDHVIAWLRLVWPSGPVMLARLWSTDSRLAGRCISGAHLMLVGGIVGAGDLAYMIVPSETFGGLAYRVTWRSGGSPRCECEDYTRSVNRPIGVWVPTLWWWVVCKHILAVVLWLRYNEEKGGSSDGMVADQSEHAGNAEAA